MVVGENMVKVLAWYDASPLPEKRIGFYLYLDGFIDDVKVYTRKKSTLLQGAQYLDDSATGRASDEELKVFEALLPKCAEPTPEGVQPVAQVKYRGKPFFAIGFIHKTSKNLRQSSLKRGASLFEV